MQTDLSDLTAHEFREDVLSATLGGNTDFPESTLDALMQAMVGLTDHIIIEYLSFSILKTSVNNISTYNSISIQNSFQNMV